MWGSVKKMGGFIFLIGCICTWVAFLGPRINPTWITDPYQLYLAGIFLVCTGIFLAILGWVLGGIHWGRGGRRFYSRGISTGSKRQRIVKWVVGCVVLVVVISVVVAFGPALVEKIRQAVSGVPGGLPLYPGAEKYEMPTAGWSGEIPSELLPFKWSGRYYRVYASENSIADWYRTRMTELGWTIEYDNRGMFTPLITAFSKGDDSAVISYSPDILSYPSDAIMFAILSGPKAGLPGAIRYFNPNYPLEIL